MPWDMKRLLGYVETIQLILAVTDKTFFMLNSSEHAIKLLIKITNYYNIDK